MKKDGFGLLIVVTVFALGLFFGLFLGRANRSAPISIQSIQATTEASVPVDLSDGKLNINTASAEGLMILPGIGSVLAQRIIEYRQTNGPFQAITDLLYVKGIGESTLYDIEKYIKVEDTP